MLAHFHLRHGWFFAIFVFCAALVVANLVHYVLFRVLRRKEEKGLRVGWGLQRYLGKPARAVFLLTCLLLALPAVPGLSTGVEANVRQGLVMAMVAALGWFAIGCIYVLQAVMLRRYDLTAEDNI